MSDKDTPHWSLVSTGLCTGTHTSTTHTKKLVKILTAYLSEHKRSSGTQYEVDLTVEETYMTNKHMRNGSIPCTMSVYKIKPQWDLLNLINQLRWERLMVPSVCLCEEDQESYKPIRKIWNNIVTTKTTGQLL